MRELIVYVEKGILKTSDTGQPAEEIIEELELKNEVSAFCDPEEMNDGDYYIEVQ